MSNPTKKLGTKHETDIKTWLRENGWPYADRLTQEGSADRGDLRLSEIIPFIIEAKTAFGKTDRAAIGTWVKELEAEVRNYGASGGAVCHKKKGTTDVGEFYAILPMKYLNALLTMAFGQQATQQAAETVPPAPPPKRVRRIHRYG